MNALEKFSLTGKVAIVTGATRGLGQGIAVGLAEAGADIVCVGRSDDSETRSKVERLGRQYLNLRPPFSSCVRRQPVSSSSRAAVERSSTSDL